MSCFQKVFRAILNFQIWLWFVWENDNPKDIYEDIYNNIKDFVCLLEPGQHGDGLVCL